MSKSMRDFEEDRALRNAARKVMLADLEHVRSSLSGVAIAGRLVGRVSEGAKDVYDVAKIHAEDHRGIIAALIGALLLWLGRGPILDALGFGDHAESGDTDTDAESVGAGTESQAPSPTTGDDNDERN